MVSNVHQAMSGVKSEKSNNRTGTSTNLTKRRIRRSPRPRPAYSFGSRVFAMIARLAIWYSIITAAFRCPSTIDEYSSQSPRICLPYLHTRAFLAPYIQPHYEAHLASHVDRVMPYYEQLQQNVLHPVARHSTQIYSSYGAPRVQQAQDLALRQWDSTFKPYVDKMNTRIASQYQDTFALYVDQASRIVVPLAIQGQKNSLYLYRELLIPSCRTAYPYTGKALRATQTGLTQVIWPRLRASWVMTIDMFNESIWPTVQILYADNIEPQLMRIGERLGRYRNSRRIWADTTDARSSENLPEQRIREKDKSSPISAAKNAKSTSIEDIKQRLAEWQKAFSRAAQAGIQELQDDIRETVEDKMQKQATVTANEMLNRLESTIADTKVQMERAQPGEELDQVEQKADKAIKDAIKSIKAWEIEYESELDSLVKTTSQKTLDVLDDVRKLGMHDISTGWALSADTTYGHWSEYSQVKASFNKWYDQALRLATSHPKVHDAKSFARGVGEKAASMEEEAAEEFARYRNANAVSPEDGRVPNMHAGVSDFESGPNAPDESDSEASSVGKREVPTDSDQGDATSTIKRPTSDGLHSKVESPTTEAPRTIAMKESDPARDVTASTSSAGVSSDDSLKDDTSTVSSAARASSQKIDRVVGGAMAQEVKYNEPILDEEIGAATPDQDAETVPRNSKLEHAADYVGDRYAEASQAVREAILFAQRRNAQTSTKGVVDSATSIASDRYSIAMDAASRALYGSQTTTDIRASATSIVSDQWSQAVAAASAAIYGSPEPTPIMAAATDAASSAFAQATSRASDHYSRAMGRVAELYSGTSGSGSPKPVHAEMTSSIASAYSAALSAASSRFENAQATATRGGNSAGATQHAIFQAFDQKYSEAVAAASKQLEAAKSAAGLAPTPTAEHQVLFSAASAQYSSLVDAASYRSEIARSAVNEALFGSFSVPFPTLKPTSTRDGIPSVLASATALASSRLAEAMSAAAAGYESLKHVGSNGAARHEDESYLQHGQRQYYAAIGQAHEQYSDFVDAASRAIYGTSTPIYQSITSAASERVYGTPTPVYQSILEAAQTQYSQASEAAWNGLIEAMMAANTAVADKTNYDANDMRKLLAPAEAKYQAAMASASKALSSVSAKASTVVVGSAEPAWAESIGHQASQNWESVLSRVSDQVYGAPTPIYASMTSRAAEFAAQATNVADEQYQAVSALFSELVHGREQDFTESVMSRLSTAYYQPQGMHVSMASSASKYADHAYHAASSLATEAIVTPASELGDSIVSAAAVATEQMQSAKSIVSAQVYGTETGPWEQGTSLASSVASSATSHISEAIYGTASSTNLGASASSAVSAVSSVIDDKIQQGRDAVEDTRQKIREAVYGQDSNMDSDMLSKVQQAVENVGAAVTESLSSVSSAVASATAKVKDEL